MGQRSREVVITLGNWENEALGMLTLYETRVGVPNKPRAVAA